MVAEKIAARKFHTHRAADILFEFQDANPVQNPGCMLDSSSDQLAPMFRVQPEPCGEENIEIGLFHNPLLFRDSDPCFCSPAAVAEVKILRVTDVHMHIGPEVRKTERGAGSHYSNE